MMRVAIQVKELISSNVTSAVESASNPLKMLNRLQREIEEAIISLEGERSLTSRRITRLEASLTQSEARVADWSDKAKTAMNHGREDLARQALIAREDTTAGIATIKDDIASAKGDLAEIETAITELEAKREDTRRQALEQASADQAGSASGQTSEKASRTEARMGRISELEKRTEFATEESAQKRAHASVDEEIDAMRRDAKIDAELASMKGGSTKKAPVTKTAAKKTAAKKAS
ncbi:MAG: PspA/IM30 family protein [Pseudomonadota bacterium]